MLLNKHNSLKIHISEFSKILLWNSQKKTSSKLNFDARKRFLTPIKYRKNLCLKIFFEKNFFSKFFFWGFWKKKFFWPKKIYEKNFFGSKKFSKFFVWKKFSKNFLGQKNFLKIFWKIFLTQKFFKIFFSQKFFLRWGKDSSRQGKKAKCPSFFDPRSVEKVMVIWIFLIFLVIFDNFHYISIQIFETGLSVLKNGQNWHFRPFSN